MLLVPVFSALQLLVPHLFGEAIDEVSNFGEEGPPDGWIVETVLLLIAVTLVASTVRFGSRLLQIGLSRLVEEELRNDLFRHLQRAPQRYFDQARIGDLVSRSTQDVELMRFMAGPTLFFGLSAALLIPGTLFMLFHVSPSVGVTVIALFGLIALGMRIAFPRIAELSRVVQDRQADISAKAQEDFSGIRVLHAFAKEEAEVESFGGLAQACYDAHVDMARSRALLHATFVAASLAAPLAVIVAGVVENLSLGQLFSAFVYMQLLAWPLLVVGWVVQTWHRARAAADRIDEVFVVEPEADNAQGEFADAAPSIEARHLTFRYEGAATAALRDVSFNVQPGQVLGLVGPVGSGKTTLVHLLARIYTPLPGQLFVGGDDVLDLDLGELRSALAVAPQDPFLFSDSLKSNVTFGAPDTVAAADIENAIAHSALASDLDAFPDGLEQVVGERGVTLSGGQKQRASLARALLAERRVLVLDDTLSAVDHDTERRILETLRQRERSQTTIVIAHRLEAVRHADHIVVLEGGDVLDQGRHDDLLTRDGWYARTWHQQQEKRQ
jgi:ATP-binding cassette subfamily B protein